MRVNKPMRLSVLSRTIELSRKPHFVASVIAAVRMGDEKTCLSEIDVWKLVEAELGQGILDEAYAKPAGEIVVHGAFFAPDKKAVPISFVGLEVRRDAKKLVDKKLAVMGPRVYKASIPTTPEPIDTMRIDWAHAFGGEGFDANPAGLGIRGKDATGPLALPNVEDPKALIRDADDRPSPVSFAPLDITSPARRAHAGTYGSDYLEKHYPGFPADFQPAFFHVAQPDQRIEGYFQPGDHISIVNMHPERPRIEATLPPLRARAFIDRKGAEGAPVFEELSLHFDTVIALPAQETLVFVWHGMTPVREDDASDVLELLIAAEDVGHPRSLEHYREVRDKRNDRSDEGTMRSLQDEDLMPPAEAGWGAARLEIESVFTTIEVEGVAKKRMDARAARITREKRAELTARGLDPDLHLPEAPAEDPVPDPTDIAGVLEYTKKVLAKAEAEQKTADEKRIEMEKGGRAAFAAMGLDWDAEAEKARDATAGPPHFDVEEEIVKLRAMAEQSRAAGQPMPDMEAVLESPGLRATIQKQRKLVLDGYRKSAIFKHPAKRRSMEDSREARDKVCSAHARKIALVDEDLTGADLSGLDLTGIELPGALLESANLEGTILDRANLAEAVLARASLRGARFRGARLGGATLGDGGLSDADFEGADLSKAFIGRLHFEDARLAGADLGEAMTFEVTFGKNDFTGAKLDKLTFHKADLRQVCFAKASLYHASFVECDLSGVDFSEGRLDGMTWVDTVADGANLTRASMVQAAWPRGVSFVKGILREAKMERGSFRDAKLVGVDFTRATMLQMDLGGADLTDAILTEADLRGTLFIRANFTRADVRGANLMDAILSNAILDGADFTRANLFRVLLSRARGDDATRFTDANLDLLVREPLRAS